MAVASKRPKLNGIVNRIKLIGVELEGGWDVVPRGEDIVKDGSVKFPGPATLNGQFFEIGLDGQPRTIAAPATATVPAPVYKGEIVSKPIPAEKLSGWLRHAYPKYVNETCGLHVHMSFHYRNNYSRLMTPEFTPFIVNKIKAFAEAEKLPKDHPQWERVLKPDHKHCAHVYLGEGQVKATRKDYESRGKPHSRYTFVNYCYNQPGGGGPRATVEVRGLAMFETAEQALKAIMVVLDGTNEFLSKLRQKDKAVRLTVKGKPAIEQEIRSYLRAA